MSVPITITRVAVPATIEDEDAADILALADVFNRALAHDLGTDNLKWVVSEMLPGWRDETNRLERGYIARRGAVVVGALQIAVPLEDGATNVEFDLLAAPEARDSGVEDALFARLCDEAEALGRPVVQTYSLHRVHDGGQHLESPTGYGSIPLDETAEFYRSHGFALRQVERNSAFDLTQDLTRVQALLDIALAAAGDDYRLETWTSPTPDRFVDGFAFALSRMSTDVPTAGLVWAEEAWDAERVQRRDAKLAEGGVLVSVAVIIHVPTGRVVAYNELTIEVDRTRPTRQWGTLVVREHRGHRLGMIVKCANILRWRDLVPTSPMITTFNAEENRPMLDVNEAIGFTPIAVAGAWQLER